MKNFLPLVFGVVIVLICCNGIESVKVLTEKPYFIQTCGIYKPDFKKCSTASIQAFVNHLVEGIPEIKDVMGTLDPLRLTHIGFQEQNPVVTLKGNLTDVTVRGLSKLKVKENIVNKNDFSFDTQLFTPTLRIEAKYGMDGNIIGAPLLATGDIVFDVENLDIRMHTKTRLVEKNGFTFYDIEEVIVDVDATDISSNYQNLLDGNSKRGAANTLYDTTWRYFFELFRPIVNKTIGQILRKIMKNVFDVIPANFFVEDIPTPDEFYGANNDNNNILNKLLPLKLF